MHDFFKCNASISINGFRATGNCGELGIIIKKLS